MKNYIYGIHASLAALQKKKSIHKAYILSGRVDEKIAEMMTTLYEQQVDVQYEQRGFLDELAKGANHQGIILEVEPDPVLTEDDLPYVLEGAVKPLLILILDGVQDPHNLGACLRSADAFGVNLVIAPKDKAVGLTPVARKIASGAAESVPFIPVTNLARTMTYLQQEGIWIYGLADETSKNIYQGDFTGNCALVLGSEGKGLRQLTRQKCDDIFAIPMQGTVSSLNVSVATGVVLAEAVRQRRFI